MAFALHQFAFPELPDGPVGVPSLFDITERHVVGFFPTGRLCVYDVVAGAIQNPSVLRYDQSEGIQGLSLSPGGKFLIIINDKGYLKLHKLIPIAEQHIMILKCVFKANLSKGGTRETAGCCIKWLNEYNVLIGLDSGNVCLVSKSLSKKLNDAFGGQKEQSTGQQGSKMKSQKAALKTAFFKSLSKMKIVDIQQKTEQRPKVKWICTYVLTKVIYHETFKADETGASTFISSIIQLDGTMKEVQDPVSKSTIFTVYCVISTASQAYYVEYTGSIIYNGDSQQEPVGRDTDKDLVIPETNGITYLGCKINVIGSRPKKLGPMIGSCVINSATSLGTPSKIYSGRNRMRIFEYDTIEHKVNVTLQKKSMDTEGKMTELGLLYGFTDGKTDFILSFNRSAKELCLVKVDMKSKKPQYELLNKDECRVIDACSVSQDGSILLKSGEQMFLGQLGMEKQEVKPPVIQNDITPTQQTEVVQETPEDNSQSKLTKLSAKLKNASTKMVDKVKSELPKMQIITKTEKTEPGPPQMTINPLIHRFILDIQEQPIKDTQPIDEGTDTTISKQETTNILSSIPLLAFLPKTDLSFLRSNIRVKLSQVLNDLNEFKQGDKPSFQQMALLCQLVSFVCDNIIKFPSILIKYINRQTQSKLAITPLSLNNPEFVKHEDYFIQMLPLLSYLYETNSTEEALFSIADKKIKEAGTLVCLRRLTNELGLSTTHTQKKRPCTLSFDDMKLCLMYNEASFDTTPISEMLKYAQAESIYLSLVSRNYLNVLDDLSPFSITSVNVNDELVIQEIEEDSVGSYSDGLTKYNVNIFSNVPDVIESLGPEDCVWDQETLSPNAYSAIEALDTLFNQLRTYSLLSLHISFQAILSFLLIKLEKIIAGLESNEQFAVCWHAGHQLQSLGITFSESLRTYSVLNHMNDRIMAYVLCGLNPFVFVNNKHLFIPLLRNKHSCEKQPILTGNQLLFGPVQTIKHAGDASRQTQVFMFARTLRGQQKLSQAVKCLGVTHKQLRRESSDILGRLVHLEVCGGR